METRTSSPKRPRTDSGSSSRNGSSRKAWETGYTVDIADLLFTPERKYLVKNNGHKVWADELKHKSIVLFIFPLGPSYTRTGEALDMIQVYNELSPLGAVEFVLVPVDAPHPEYEFPYKHFKSPEDVFDPLFYNLPFPAIPLKETLPFDGPLMKVFGLDESLVRDMPYWVIIDPRGPVVFNRLLCPDLFKFFGGAELHPLSPDKISSVIKEHHSLSQQALINSWDQRLASPDRDYVLSIIGHQVVHEPISSLKGNVIGLYFCDNVPDPPSMQLINKVYDKAVSGGIAFKIVQINLPWHSFKDRYPSASSEIVLPPKGVTWFTLPFKDPSCRKLLRIFPSQVFDDRYGRWGGNHLVIIDARRSDVDDVPFDVDDVPFEFLGVEILERWGIEGYPFTRPSLFATEYKIQKRDVTLQSLFPPGECLRHRSGELVDASTLLLGKNVLVLFYDHTDGKPDQGKFVTMLRSAYREQDKLPEEGKFEVVYVSTHYTVSPQPDGKPSYPEFMEGLQWLAHPLPHPLPHDPLPHRQGLEYLGMVFKSYLGFPAAAAFDRKGNLIAKEIFLDTTWKGESTTFPFISRELGDYIQQEVNSWFGDEWERSFG